MNMDLKQIPITWKGKKWKDHTKNSEKRMRERGFKEADIQHILLMMEVEKQRFEMRPTKLQEVKDQLASLDYGQLERVSTFIETLKRVSE